MDGVFTLPEAARADFLRSLVQSFGCPYVCLWQYDSNLSNLFFLDGYYDVTKNQPSSSLGSVAERLFHQYRALTFDVNHECVPGVALRNQLPYIELQLLDLLRLTSTEIQYQFFQEARIEIAVLMGCKNGEIELGFSNISQVIKQTILPSSSSSSSSSFMSLSTGSPDQCSSSLLLSSIPGTSLSHFPQTLPTQTHQQQSIQAIDLAPVIPSNFPTPEGEHEAIVRAFISVMSSLSSSSTSQQHQPHQILPNYSSIVHPGATAFNTYRPDTMNPNITPYMGSNFRRQSLQSRSFAFFTNLNLMRMRERVSQPAYRPISTQHQQHHMISERRRREKLNESFLALRALLPPGTKKTKATILTTAKETMRSLMDEIEKLNSRNQQLMTVLSAKEATVSATSIEENKAKPSISSSNERLNVLVSAVSESSSLSEERMVEVQVTLKGESSRVDVLIRLLEFLERVQNVNLVCMYANNHIIGGTTINQLTFRLRIIEGSECNEHALEEAVRRVVADTIQWKPLDK